MERTLTTGAGTGFPAFRADLRGSEDILGWLKKRVGGRGEAGGERRLTRPGGVVQRPALGTFAPKRMTFFYYSDSRVRVWSLCASRMCRLAARSDLISPQRGSSEPGPMSTLDGLLTTRNRLTLLLLTRTSLVSLQLRYVHSADDGQRVLEAHIPSLLSPDSMLGRTLSCARSVGGSSSNSSPTFLPTLLASHPPQGHLRRTFQSTQQCRYSDDVTVPLPSTSFSTEASPSAAPEPSSSSSNPSTPFLPIKLRTLKPKERKPLPPRQIKTGLLPPSSAAFATAGLEGEANFALSHLPIWTPPTPTTDPESSASGGLTLGEEEIRSSEEGEVSEAVDAGEGFSPGSAEAASARKTKILVRPPFAPLVALISFLTNTKPLP